MGGPFGRDILAGMREEARRRALPCDIRVAMHEALYPSRLRWMLRERMIDGIVTRFALSSETTDAMEAGLPVVQIDPPVCASSVASGLPYACVRMDVEGVARDAVRHFQERSYFRAFGFVETDWRNDWSPARAKAFRKALAAAGKRCAVFRHWGRAPTATASRGLDVEGLSAWLRALERPAAVLAANDATAHDVLLVCRQQGLDVPRDIALLGMDDDEAYCRSGLPNLSSIHFDGRGAGASALGALIALRAGGPPGPDLSFGAERIVQRASTGNVSSAGALVQKAVDFIEQNACEGISTDDVVRHLGVSRSLATLRFRELRGTSLLEAIHARCVEKAKWRLTRTDDTLDEIAAACGRHDPKSFRRLFQGLTGVSPAEYRRHPPPDP